MLLILGWHSGVFLLGKAGIVEPEETFALLVWYSLGAIVFIIAASCAFNNVINKLFEHRETMEYQRIGQLRYRQRLQQSILTDSRRIGDKARLGLLVIEILMRAYEYQVQNRRPFRGNWRPWSRRSVGKIMLRADGETEPVGENLAVKAKEFLLEHEVIIDDQLNLERFPDLASVQRLLRTPILLTAPGAKAGLYEANTWAERDGR